MISLITFALFLHLPLPATQKKKKKTRKWTWGLIWCHEKGRFKWKFEICLVLSYAFHGMRLGHWVLQGVFRCLHEMWDVTKMRHAPRCSLCFGARRCVVVVTSYASSFLYSLSLLLLFYTLFSPTLFYFLFFCSAVFAAAAVMLYCCFYILKDDYEATCHVLNIGANSD